MVLRFKHYRLESVYLGACDAQRAEVTAFWLREKALADVAEATRRADEVVFHVRRDDSGELAGVSTVSLARAGDGRVYYAYRMFLRPQDRVPYLMWAVIAATRDFLAGFAHPQARPAGMLHINENPKLMRPGARRFFLRHGYRYCGTTPYGQDVWVAEFPPRPAEGPLTSPPAPR
jgi:hypothetical protein